MFDVIITKRIRQVYAPRGPCYPEYPEIPKDHPCYNCPARSRETTVLYCFLPKCNKELFTSHLKGAKPHEEKE